MKKLVHVKSLITLALCLMMCFTFFAPASTVQAKKRVVDNVFMYPTDPYSYPTCTGWVPCKKTFTSSKKASKTYVRETAWKVIDTAYLYKAATSRGKVFYDNHIFYLISDGERSLYDRCPRFKSRGYGYWLSIVLSAIWLALYTGSDRLQLFDVMDSIQPVHKAISAHDISTLCDVCTCRRSGDRA